MKYYQSNHGNHIENYRERTLNVIQLATQDHPRTLAIRVDLHDPAILDNGDTIDCLYDNSPNVIARFINSLKAKIDAYQQRQRANGVRVYPNTLRYAWVREYSLSGKRHYHVILFLNKDAFYHLGDYDLDRGSLRTMITTAWCSALAINSEEGQHLIHYAEKGVFELTRKDVESGYYPGGFLERIDYMAKEKSKVFGDGNRNFGCSNK